MQDDAWCYAKMGMLFYLLKDL